MSYQLVKAGEDINQQGRNYREYLIDSSADLSSLPTAKMSEGSKAYTKEYKSVYKLKEDGSWQTVKEGNESGSGSGSGSGSSGSSGSATANEDFIILVKEQYNGDSQEFSVTANKTYDEIVDAWNKGHRSMFITHMAPVENYYRVVSYQHLDDPADPYVILTTIEADPSDDYAGIDVYSFAKSGAVSYHTLVLSATIPDSTSDTSVGELETP